jgi:hypothetical protein
MTKDEVLKLALEALQNSVDLVREDAYNAEKLYGNYPTRQGKVRGLKVLADDHENAITAIKQALAAPVQEPVAYDKTEMNCFVQELYDKKMCEGKHGHYETMFHCVHQAIKRVTPPAAQPAVPDAIHHTDLSESLEYIQGWNDCRQAMLEMMK